MGAAADGLRQIRASGCERRKIVCTGRCDVQVLDENWNIVETITNEDLKPMV
jgi:hypothetical protein